MIFYIFADFDYIFKGAQKWVKKYAIIYLTKFKGGCRNGMDEKSICKGQRDNSCGNP